MAQAALTLRSGLVGESTFGYEKFINDIEVLQIQAWGLIKAPLQ